MPFDARRDAIAPDSPKRILLTDDQGQLLDGGVRGYVWSVASLAWRREEQAVLSTDTLTVNSAITSMPSVNIGFVPSINAVARVTPHIGLNGDPFSLLHETAQYTTTQTGTALVTPTAGNKLVVTKVQIQAGGIVAGTVQLWFGAAADTTYTRGTDRAIFDGEFAPSATVKPGVVMDGPWIAGAADHVLRVTDSAAIDPLTVTVWYYEII